MLRTEAVNTYAGVAFKMNLHNRTTLNSCMSLLSCQQMAVASAESASLYSRNPECIGQCVHVHISHSEALVSGLWSVWDVHRPLCVKRKCVFVCTHIQVHVQVSALKCLSVWQQNKESLLSVCGVCVCVCVRMYVQENFMSGRASCGLGQWSITLWWWGDGMTSALSAPPASVW